MHEGSQHLDAGEQEQARAIDGLFLPHGSIAAGRPAEDLVATHIRQFRLQHRLNHRRSGPAAANAVTY